MTVPRRYGYTLLLVKDFDSPCKVVCFCSLKPVLLVGNSEQMWGGLCLFSFPIELRLEKHMFRPGEVYSATETGPSSPQDDHGPQDLQVAHSFYQSQFPLFIRKTVPVHVL